jgi:hypothetical protein
LSNTNEKATVSILQNILELNKALAALAAFFGVHADALQEDMDTKRTAINFEHKEGCCNKPQSESLVMPHSRSPQALKGFEIVNGFRGYKNCVMVPRKEQCFVKTCQKKKGL